MSISVGLIGFGRTGSLVAKEIVTDPELSLKWVCRRHIPSTISYASHALGFDENFAPFVASNNLSLEFLKANPVDLVIDFSSNETSRLYSTLADASIKIVSAISKYDDEDFVRIKAASNKTAILASPNITLGINWLIIASKVLQKIIPHADIEIVEEHFRQKNEVSGTALKLAEHLDLNSKEHVNSVRVGGIVGKHQVIFGLPYQTIRITHESISRAAFGTGAIFAAKWLLQQKSGLYKMENIFYEKFLAGIESLV